MRQEKLKLFDNNVPDEETDRGTHSPSQSSTGQERYPGDKYAIGDYWRERSDLLYYRYLDFILRTVGRNANSLIDVGSGNSPYLEWFDWIGRRVSVDISTPYRSENVEGVEGNIMDLKLEKFDICTCFQVLEHVPDAGPFARRLLELGTTVVVSVPYKWPEGKTAEHVHDPVNYEKLTGWIGRKANYRIIVKEPFRRLKSRRLIAIYDSDPDRRFGFKDVKARIRN